MKTKKHVRGPKKTTTKCKFNRYKKHPVKKRTKSICKDKLLNFENNVEKVIIFDLDETIGCFQRLYSLFYYINEHRQKNKYYNLSFYEKVKILDDNPYFLRTNILSIFTKLGLLQEKNNIRVVIFTNNTGGYDWPNFIRNYINFKLKKKIISQVIPIYKNNDIIYEPLRTSNEKRYNDLCRCLNIPSTTEVCFIDDREHDQMYSDNVSYIRVKEYKYFPNLKKLLNNLISNKKYTELIPNIENFMETNDKNLINQRIIEEGNINLMKEMIETENIKTRIFKYIFKK